MGSPAEKSQNPKATSFNKLHSFEIELAISYFLIPDSCILEARKLDEKEVQLRNTIKIPLTTESIQIWLT